VDININIEDFESDTEDVTFFLIFLVDDVIDYFLKKLWYSSFSCLNPSKTQTFHRTQLYRKLKYSKTKCVANVVKCTKKWQNYQVEN